MVGLDELNFGVVDQIWAKLLRVVSRLTLHRSRPAPIRPGYRTLHGRPQGLTVVEVVPKLVLMSKPLLLGYHHGIGH